MAITASLADAQAQLLTVQAAIQSLIAGKRVTDLKIGSGQFIRQYTYQEITLDSLRDRQTELLADINYWSGLVSNALPNFAGNKTIPMMVRKDYFNAWADR